MMAVLFFYEKIKAMIFDRSEEKEPFYPNNESQQNRLMRTFGQTPEFAHNQCTEFLFSNIGTKEKFPKS